MGCCVGGGTAGSGLDGNGSQGSATDRLRAKATRARLQGPVAQW